MADLPAAERLVLDLTDPASIDEAMAAAGRVEVVINNAAMTVSGPVEAVPADLVERVLATNVLGPLRVMQAALPTMRERVAGRILNISSPAGRFAPTLCGGVLGLQGRLRDAQRGRPVRGRPLRGRR
jgi:NAD(P)-dependent dehydrogenase (short-subunit alcohol dehydrogenase family)